MRPRPCAFMTGATALVRRIGPVRLTAMILSHTSEREIVEVGEGDRFVVGGVVDEDVDAPEALADLRRPAVPTATGSVMSQANCRRLDLGSARRQSSPATLLGLIASSSHT